MLYYNSPTWIEINNLINSNAYLIKFTTIYIIVDRVLFNCVILFKTDLKPCSCCCLIGWKSFDAAVILLWRRTGSWPMLITFRLYIRYGLDNCQNEIMALNKNSYIEKAYVESHILPSPPTSHYYNYLSF